MWTSALRTGSNFFSLPTYDNIIFFFSHWINLKHLFLMGHIWILHQPLRMHEEEEVLLSCWDNLSSRSNIMWRPQWYDRPAHLLLSGQETTPYPTSPSPSRLAIWLCGWWGVGVGIIGDAVLGLMLLRACWPCPAFSFVALCVLAPVRLPCTPIVGPVLVWITLHCFLWYLFFLRVF